MTLLNDETLCGYVNRPDPLLVIGLRAPAGFDKDSPVQPSSIDLHIGSIFIPETQLGEDGSEDKPLSSHTLKPGQTALITTLETLDLPNDIAAIGFPPSHISAQGLLMTNPGHVDPGYKGQMHFAVINMGRQEFSLRKGGMIVTVLFFAMSQPAKQGYAARYGAIIPGPPSQEKINRLSADFLDVGKRAEDVAKAEVNKAGLLLERFKARERAIIGIMGILMAAAGYLGSSLSGGSELKTRVEKLEAAQAKAESSLGFDRRLTILEMRFPGQPPTSSPAISVSVPGASSQPKQRPKDKAAK